MKKIIKSFVIAVLVAVSFSLFGVKNAAAVSKVENKLDILVIRTVENGIHYISLYTDSGTLILKFEEL